MEYRIRRLLTWAGAIYLICVTGLILYPWLLGEHLFDLSLTISLYAGLYVPSSVWFFLGITAISRLLWKCVRESKIHPLRRFVYALALLSAFGCGWFPCNHSRSPLSSEIHDLLSYALVILIGLSFLLMLVARRGTGRIFPGLSFLFTAVFVAGFITRLPAFKHTILIWENLLMALLFFGIASDARTPETSKPH